MQLFSWLEPYQGYWIVENWGKLAMENQECMNLSWSMPSHSYQAGLWRWAFFLAGGVKIMYDLLLLWSFRGVKVAHEEKPSAIGMADVRVAK